MNPSPPLKVLLEHLDWNAQRLTEVLNNEKTDYFRDAALQRFEFTYDSALKCIRSAGTLSANETDETCYNHAMGKAWLPENADPEKLVNCYQQIKSESRAQHADSIFQQLPGFSEAFHFLHQALKPLS